VAVILSDRTCGNCGKTFTPNHGNRLYCSPECQKEGELARQRDRNGVVSRTCTSCGERFVGRSWGANPLCGACRRLGKTNRQAGRRCHDCGRPTPNYRCESCWRKVRRGNADAD